MSTLVKTIIVFLLSQTVLFAQDNMGQNITVKITNLDGNAGKVYVALYNSETTFLEKKYKSTISTIKDSSCEVVFENVPNGVYAISLFHDKNDNNKMDSNFLGIPKEDYGCSNNAKGFMGPPKWKDAKFKIQNNSVTQTIKL
ncbi:DUF2141 domain-containing protein [Flavobacteriaceae bacterium S0825]|uniref:DUF2141 domain-containing protein n=1 Tax=Gaetbulibacter sp. S0825 TaxID=2720084 RepID=UPI00142F570B|nr:DUF2141 domain-containing protein [Gaetbulibacter sp. S0825]MCK0109253.1 DUF2141 domain-containing protein [Flavobacteriaceae bacterium S0825]NIX64888.1 DUF2141 domain-containing protein [Gaetbulibacter sp. S0825]